MYTSHTKPDAWFWYCTNYGRRHRGGKLGEGGHGTSLELTVNLHRFQSKILFKKGKQGKNCKVHIWVAQFVKITKGVQPLQKHPTSEGQALICGWLPGNCMLEVPPPAMYGQLCRCYTTDTAAKCPHQQSPRAAPKSLSSSTRMISWRSRAGVRSRTLCTVRSKADKASL